MALAAIVQAVLVAAAQVDLVAVQAVLAEAVPVDRVAVQAAPVVVKMQASPQFP
ncbi:hypothetical protein RJP21_14275 [Paenibacillus sp. VCA1]|uniref:hypothetical protein n=1 Tax=Paenibacillus sp. VCA1 TaxID=3039148 RepID=UPI00287290A3|nr:hypothetical protein [Paenibacillus sp. VCA1]MDR9854778.1 hypothetical protein [Paenibacillus sp. VCA1]